MNSEATAEFIIPAAGSASWARAMHAGGVTRLQSIVLVIFRRYKGSVPPRSQGMPMPFSATELLAELPRLRRYARILTDDPERADRFVEETLLRCSTDAGDSASGSAPPHATPGAASLRQRGTGRTGHAARDHRSRFAGRSNSNADPSASRGRSPPDRGAQCLRNCASFRSSNAKFSCWWRSSDVLHGHRRPASHPRCDRHFAALSGARSVARDPAETPVGPEKRELIGRCAGRSAPPLEGDRERRDDAVGAAPARDHSTPRNGCSRRPRRSRAEPCRGRRAIRCARRTRSSWANPVQ